MHIYVVDLPNFHDVPALSAQSPCIHHRTEEHAIDICICFSSLDLNKPAGILGQDVAKEETKNF